MINKLICNVEITLCKKIKSFCDRGFHLWRFLSLYELIINKLYRVQPPQKGFTFYIVGLCLFIL